MILPMQVTRLSSISHRIPTKQEDKRCIKKNKETTFDIGKCFWRQVNSAPVSEPEAAASLIAGMKTILVAAMTAMSTDDIVPIDAPTLRVLRLIMSYS